MIKKLALLLVLSAFPLYVHAQNAPDLGITQHLTLSASATGFMGGSGSQPATIAAIGFNVTPHFSVAYSQLLVPSTSTQAAVTASLGVVIGNTLSSKLSFDPTQINVTFQGGGGKSNQSGTSRIAETAGAYISYPLAQNVSFQLFGISLIRSGNVTGVLTTKQISTGLNFSF